QIFVKLTKPDDPKFRPYQLAAAASALQILGLSDRPPDFKTLWPSKQRSEALKAIAAHFQAAALPLVVELKQKALGAIKHAKTYGDVRPLERFVESLPKGYWEVFRQWLYAHTPIRRDPKTGHFRQQKRDEPGYCDYDLEGASQTS